MAAMVSRDTEPDDALAPPALPDEPDAPGPPAPLVLELAISSELVSQAPKRITNAKRHTVLNRINELAFRYFLNNTLASNLEPMKATLEIHLK